MKDYTFHKRAFLNPASTNTTSYIFAMVQSTNGGEDPWGGNMLKLADCHHAVELEFSLGNARDRYLSLKKINKLIATLTGFRDALTAECELIEKKKKGSK